MPLTALGSPVVPLLKVKKPHTSLLVLPGGIWNGNTWPLIPDLSPIFRRSLIVVYPGASPRVKKCVFEEFLRFAQLALPLTGRQQLSLRFSLEQSSEHSSFPQCYMPAKHQK